MVKKNLMESVTTIISMDIKQVNAQRNLSLKESVTIATNKDTSLKWNLVEKIVKEIFGWDYNTWCRCHYYGEFGHIGTNFI